MKMSKIYKSEKRGLRWAVILALLCLIILLVEGLYSISAIHRRGYWVRSIIVKTPGSDRPINYGVIGFFYNDTELRQLVKITYETGGLCWSVPDDIPGVALRHWHFSARFLGSLVIDTPGQYEFTFEYDDGLRFYLDGEIVFDDWKQRKARASAKVSLQRGNHPLRIDYCNRAYGGHLRVYWASLGLPRQLVPVTALRPDPML